MKHLSRFLIILLSLSIVITGCNNDKEVDPSIKTVDATPTSASTILIKGSILSLGSLTIKDYGVQYYYSDINNPTQISLGSKPAAGDFQKEVSVTQTYQNSFSTTVFARAYLQNEKGFVYGESKQVIFPQLSETSMSPLSGKTGDQITITGNNFSDNTSDNIVSVGGVVATIVSATSTQIVFTVPDGITNYNNGTYYSSYTVTLKVGSQQITLPQTFSLLPNVTSFSPQSGGVGTYVTITGSNFPSNYYYGGYSLLVGGVSASLSYISSTTLSFTVPYGISQSKVTITLIINGTSINVGDFTIAAPSISGFTSAIGIVGSLITLQGTNLTNDTGTNYNYPIITVGGITASVQSITSGSIQFYVPAGLAIGSYDVTMTTPIRTITAPSKFTISSPSITSLSALSGYTSTYVTIYGQYLGSNNYPSSVYLGTTQVSIYSWSDSAITVIIPSYMSAGSYKFTVNTGGQSAVSSDYYTILSN